MDRNLLLNDDDDIAIAPPPPPLETAAYDNSRESAKDNKEHDDKEQREFALDTAMTTATSLSLEQDDDDDEDVNDGDLLKMLTSSNKTRQLMALSLLNDILVVATDELPLNMTLMIKTILKIISTTGDDFINQELMLLGYRCLANLTEAIPNSIIKLVQLGAVKILIEKLVNVEYIDLAEQSLAVLMKISVEYPSIIIKANGLVAVLQYIDFFNIHVQRIAVSIAANSCRGLSSVSLASGASDNDQVTGVDQVLNTVNEVMPNLERLLQHDDAKIADHAVTCIACITEWATRADGRIETIAQPSILRVITSIITDVSSDNIALVKVLSNVVKGSPKLGLQLVTEFDICNVIVSILTAGELPFLQPENSGNADHIQNDRALSALMKVIVNKPADYILEVIGLAIELLPALPKSHIFNYKIEESIPATDTMESVAEQSHSTLKSSDEKLEKDDARLKLLKTHPDLLLQYITKLVPIFTSVFSTTVNQNLRRKCIECILKAIWYASGGDVMGTGSVKNFGDSVFTACGKGFAKFVSDLVSYREEAFPDPLFKSMDTQPADCKEALLLVTGGLMITDIIMESCGAICANIFIREGVLAEIGKVAASIHERKEAAIEFEANIDPSKKDILSQNLPVGIHDNDVMDSADEVVLEEELDLIEIKDLLDKAEKLGLRPLSSPGRDNGAESEGESIVASSSSQDTDSHAAASRILMSNMRQALERMNKRGSASVSTSSSAAQRMSTTIVAFNGQRYSQSDLVSWCLHFSNQLNSKAQAFSTTEYASNRVISELKSLIESIGTNVDSIAELELLRRLANIVVGSCDVDGVTGYELVESGIMDKLIAYLSELGIGELPLAAPMVSKKGKQKDTLSDIIPSDQKLGKMKPSVAMRCKSFLHVFLNGPMPRNFDNFHVPSAFKMLVFKLQQLLSRIERFQVYSATIGSSPSGGFGSFEHGLSLFNPYGGGSPASSNQLTRQIRLKLVPASLEDQSVPKQYRTGITVSILAISLFSQLESFLRPRILSTSGNIFEGLHDNASLEEREMKAQSSESEADGNPDFSNEEDEDEMNNHEESQDEFMNVSDIQMTNEEVARKIRESSFASGNSDAASSVANNDGRSSLGSSSAIPIPKAHSLVEVKDVSSGDASFLKNSSSSAAFKISFSMGDTPINPDSTIFGVLYNSERKRLGPKSVPNLWAQTFTITYQKRDSNFVTSAQPIITEAKTSHQISSLWPASFLKFPTEEGGIGSSTQSVLVLLRLLHGLNTRYMDFYMEEDDFFIPSPALTEAAAAAEGPENSLPIPDIRPGGELNIITGHGIIALTTAAFQNSKLTAKLNRQMDEPLVVASRILPEWCRSVIGDFSFLVPFESRLVYLQSTAFGFSRSLARWQQQSASLNARNLSGQANVIRAQRQKVRIVRTKLLESMVKVMEIYGSSNSILEIEFFDEVGTGLGPTLEFFSEVCKLVQRQSKFEFGGMKMSGFWRDLANDLTISDTHVTTDGINKSVTDEYISASLGLFPRPIKFGTSPANEKIHILLYKSLGTFVAKALSDGRIIDFPFNQVFLQLILNDLFTDQFHSNTSSQLHAIKFIDPQLHHSLLALLQFVKQKKELEGKTIDATKREQMTCDLAVCGSKIDDMCLDFTLPGYPLIELKPDGRNIDVNLKNLEEYVKLVADFTVGSGVKKQIDAFRKGMNQVFSVNELKSFSIIELCLLFGGNEEEDWSYQTIMECIKADHGYTNDSKTIQNLVTMMSTFTSQQKRDFLQFISGSVRLPRGGFKAMTPLTVVCKTVDGDGKPDDYLPSVMTCVNYLKVPNYSTLEVMMQRFTIAFEEGQGSFHLS